MNHTPGHHHLHHHHHPHSHSHHQQHQLLGLVAGLVLALSLIAGGFMLQPTVAKLSGKVPVLVFGLVAIAAFLFIIMRQRSR